MAGSGVGHLYHELEFPIKCDRLSRFNACLANNGIISIMLSSAELNTLDLSHLQLFCSENIEAPSSELCHLVERSNSIAGNDQWQSSSPSSSASSSPPSTFSFPTVPESQDRRQEPIEDQERAGDICAFDSPDSFAFFPDTKDRKSMKTVPPNIGPSDFFLPIFKSKAVLEAEKVLAENLSKKICLSVTQAAGKKKALSLDELTFQTQVVSVSHNTYSTDEHRPTQLTQDDSTLHHRSNKVKPKAPLPMLDVKQRPIVIQNANLLDVSQESITGDTMKNLVRSLTRQMTREMDMEGSKASIDLKASPAAKFLLQLMPWEISPWTPFTPVRTPAAVPFKWEEAPGKPRLVDELEATKPDQSLHLPPRLFISQASDRISTHRSEDQPRYNNHMKQEQQDFVFAGSISPKEDAQFDTLTADQQQSSFVSQSECSTRGDSKNYLMDERDLSSTKAVEMASENVFKTSDVSAHGSDAGSARALVSIRQHLSSEYALPSPWKGPLTPGMSSPCRNLGPLQENQQQHKGVRSSVRVWLERCNCKRKGKVQEGGNLWAPSLAAYYKTLNYQPSVTGKVQKSQLEDEKKKRQRSVQEKSSWTDNKHDQQVSGNLFGGGACPNMVSKPRVVQSNLPSVKQWRWQQRPRKWAKRPRRWIMRRIRTSYRVFVAVYKAIIRKAFFWRKQRHWQLRSSIDSYMPYQSLDDQ